MNVGEICTRSVVVISKSAPVLEAAQRMRREHVGDLVVVEPTSSGGLKPVGIITDRDLVVGVMAMDLVHEQSLLVGDVMSADLVIAHEGDSVTDVLRRMRQDGIRRVPVVDDHGTLAGLLTFDDLVEILAEQLGLLAELVPQERSVEEEQRR